MSAEICALYFQDFSEIIGAFVHRRFDVSSLYSPKYD